MKLICHTDCTEGELQYLTEGRVYEVNDEDSKSYIITDDTGYPHYLTKKQDHEGKSYKTWLTVLGGSVK